MKKIIITVMMMFITVNASTPDQIDHNYELCVKFTGEIDPKNPQINFDECDKWIKAKEDLDYYRNIKKLTKSEYYNMIGKTVAVKTADVYGKTIYKYPSLMLHTFIKQTKHMNNEDFSDEASSFLAAKSDYADLHSRCYIPDYYTQKDMIEQNAFSKVLLDVLNMYINSGALPSSFTINIGNSNTKSSQVTYGIDTFGLLNKLRGFAGYKKRGNDSAWYIQKQRILLEAFFLMKGLRYAEVKQAKDIIKIKFYDQLMIKDLVRLYTLLQKQDKDTIIFLDYIANGKYDDGTRFLLSFPLVKVIQEKTVKKAKGASLGLLAI